MLGDVSALNFFQGEEKYVEARAAAAKKNETVTITSATYELSKKSDENAVETGDCEIRGDRIRFLLKTSEAGTYSLKITVKTGAETVIQRVPVSVKR